MKIIKPQRLGFSFRTFEHHEGDFLVLTIFVFFPFGEPLVPLPEVAMWKALAEQLGKDVAIDVGMPKPKGELLVSGSCHVPGGIPAPASYVRVTAGEIDKRLFVVGNRTWKHGVPTGPEPFTEMRINWQNAYGGESFDANPAGKGHKPVQTAAGAIQVLPNVEDPDHLVQSPSDHPVPAGLDALDITSPKHFSKMGTYDATWLKEDFPGLARDLDWSVFNCAPDDQQLSGYWSGGEVVVIENMHPTKALQKVVVPSIKTRAFAIRATKDGEEFEEVSTRLDTVRLFPGIQRGVLIYRGIMRVREDDAADVKVAAIAAEDPAMPKTVEHYRQVIADRLDHEKGALLALRDSDLMPLMPPGTPVVPKDGGDPHPIASDSAVLRKNLEQKRKREMAKMKDMFIAAGLPPDNLPELPDPAQEPEEQPDLENLPALVERMTKKAEEQKAAAEKIKADKEIEARESFALMGLDYDKMARDARAEAAGPPKFRAEQYQQQLQEIVMMGEQSGADVSTVKQMLDDPKFLERMRAMQDMQMQAYRTMGHHQYPARALDPASAGALKMKVQTWLAQGKVFAARDLTGADLSGMNLRGANLAGALLESANLSGCDLSGANLSEAVLCHANLTGAKLTGANLTRANLGDAVLIEADLTGGADLSEAVLAQAKVRGALLQGATLSGADVSEVQWEGAALKGMIATDMLFLRCNLDGIVFGETNLSKSNFIECSLKGTDFSGANLAGCNFVKCSAPRASFRKASAPKLRIVHESSFPNACFAGLVAPQSNFRGTDLQEADFSMAKLPGADFSETNLNKANFYRAEAVGAYFIRAELTGANLLSCNLMQAVLGKANLFGANLRDANLVRADLAKIRVDTATQLDEAHLEQARFVPRRSYEQE